jgi:hypothetical protein
MVPPPLLAEPKPRITLGIEAGEFCNRLLAVAVGISLAKSSNSTFVLWGGWKTQTVHELDLELLQAYAGDSIALEGDAQPMDAMVLHEDAQQEIWCGSKVSLDVIRFGMRPRAEARELAERALFSLRRHAQVNMTMAVHGRNQRNICRKRTNKFPDFCHESSLYDNEKRKFDICDYRMSKSLASAVTAEWPEHRLQGLGVFLMTDRERPDMDATYLASGLPSPFAHAVHENFSMVADLWAAANADYYLANPISSCEGVVAQWRAELHGPDRVRQFPRTCFEPYRRRQAETDVCRHTRAFTLDDPQSMNACEMVLALAVALSKLDGVDGGRLVLWGPWRDLVETHIDLAHLRRARPSVQFVLTTKMPLSRLMTKPIIWYAALLDPRKEATCAAGKALDALRSALRPRLGLAHGAGNVSLLPTLPNTYCFGRTRRQTVDGAQTSSSFSRNQSPSVSLAHVWQQAQTASYQGSALSACDQIAAHWAGREMEPKDCFGPYFRSAEDSRAIREIKSFSRWGCA